jgi:hypothetical protein
MRKLTVLLVTALAVTNVIALEKGESEFEHNGWFRYTRAMKKFDLGEPTASRYTLERGYLRYSHQWTNQLFTKLTVDIHSSDKYAEGATVRLKEAYLDVNVPMVKDWKFTAGLQKHYFGLMYSWDYTHPDKDLADAQGVCASADYGLTLNGFLPAGLGEAQLGVYNGEGYKYAGKYLDKYPEYLGNIRLTPFAGVTLGVSAFINASDMSLYKNDKSYRTSDNKKRVLPDTANKDRFGLTPMAKLAFGPVSLTGTYVIYDYNRTSSYYAINYDSTNTVLDSTLKTSEKKYAMTGLDVMPLVSLFKRKLDVYGRFSTWKQVEDDTLVNETKSVTRYGAGFNYHLVRREKGKPGAEFQFAWVREQPKKADSDPTDTFMAQFRFEYARLFLAP